MSNSALFMSPQDAELDNYNGDYTPDLDYLDGENSFDFDNADLGGEMIGALPRSNSEQTEDGEDGELESHEKRKSPDDKDGDDEVDHKRQEGEKGAKKPGRKPLTSEPTTKRKAQNRAAQRAFRERKERHLKDLETKVNQMNKAHEADKHEKGMLKAQVERLQVELREYRKRLSLNSGSGNAKGSPPLNAYTGPTRTNSGSKGGNNGNFQFDFPKFGALPGSQIFGNQQSPANGVLQRESITPPAYSIKQSHGPTAGIIGGLGGLASRLPAQVQRTESQTSQNGRALGPKTTTPTGNGSNAPTPPQPSDIFPSVGYSSTNNMHGFASTLPQMGGDNMFGDLFSPSLLKNDNFDNSNSYFDNALQQVTANGASKGSIEASNGGESTAGLNRVFQFNESSSASDSASPSNSSTSQWNANGANSSCGTSPEPSHGSPANKAHNSVDSCNGDKNDPLRQFSDSSQLFGSQLFRSQQPANGWGNNGLAGTNVDFSVPSAGTFNPVLFGDYRDTNDTTFNSNDFTSGNGFFDEALNSAPFDYGSPSNLFGILQQSPQQTHTTLSANNSAAIDAPTPSKNLMAEIEKARDGGDDDYRLSCSGNASAATTTMSSNGKLISCNNIWNQLQSNPDFQAGTFDLDSLCSELRVKARCSESGVLVSQDHVDAALKKLGKKDESGKFVPVGTADMPPLIFEQESWDNVLKKLGGNGQ